MSTQPKNYTDYLLGPQQGEYPKAVYRAVMTSKGERGDIVSPGYERIEINDSGTAQRRVDYHMYITMLAKDAKHEKALSGEGWVDHPDKLKVEVAS